jgi:hypothetical protein
MTYGIKHRDSGKFFAGFDVATKEPLWLGECDARHYADARDAKEQALLFRCNDIRAQVKPHAARSV